MLSSHGTLFSAPGISFIPDTVEASKAEFACRAHASYWDDLIIDKEARLQMVEDFKAEMEEFAKLYQYDNRPFLEGETMSYADIIVGD